MRELNNPAALRSALREVRDHTLLVYAHLDEQQRRFPYLRTVNPPVWELAHIGWFQEFWCLRYRDGLEPRASRLPNADPMLDSAIIPHAQRWNLPELSWEAMQRYLAAELDDTLEALESAAPAARYFFQLALFHEDMHGEALLMSLQTLGLPSPRLGPALSRPQPEVLRNAGEIEFDGGVFLMGSQRSPTFVFDNEKWAHEVRVRPFALSTTTVTNAQYLDFVEGDAYQRADFWTEVGWAWRCEAGLQAPRDWRKDNLQWLARRFEQWEPLALDEPAVNVCAHEAEAYCKSVGRRLPTETEWEFAARAGVGELDRYPWGPAPLGPGEVNLNSVFGGPVPAAALPGADSSRGLRQMLGNVWEWTSTPFAPYPGFAPDPYKEYSQPWFYDHRVLRGGCFTTRARLVHNRWRNFYLPHRNDVFAGFRTARSL